MLCISPLWKRGVRGDLQDDSMNQAMKSALYRNNITIKFSWISEQIPLAPLFQRGETGNKNKCN